MDDAATDETTTITREQAQDLVSTIAVAIRGDLEKITSGFILDAEPEYLQRLVLAARRRLDSLEQLLGE